MRVPPPTTISPQAQAILRDATEIVGRSTELAVIHQRRKASAAAYVPAGLRLALDLGVTLSEEMIAGVPTQVLKPANIVGNSAILYFFGGGYVQGSPDEDLAITARLAHLTRRRVYAPYYALAPEHPFPGAVVDAQRAVSWALANAALLGIDPARFIALLHYDGTPITARFITEAITAHVHALAVAPRREKLKS